MPISNLSAPAQPSLSPNDDRAEKFGGNILHSYQGIMFIAYFSVVILDLVTGKGRPASVEDSLYMAGGVIAAYVVLGLQLFYFKVSDTQLIIKNYIFFWYTRKYEKEEISSLAIGRWYRTGKYLVVSTTGTSSKKMYTATTLWEKIWTALEKKLATAGFPFNKD
jgi:hypothetical protein